VRHFPLGWMPLVTRRPLARQQCEILRHFLGSLWHSCTLILISSIYFYQCYTHTHTHPFNCPFSGTTRVSQYQKGKTNLDFTEARDSKWQWHQLGHMQVCTSLQTENHVSTPLLSYLQARCPSCHPTNSVKALLLAHYRCNRRTFNKIAEIFKNVLTNGSVILKPNKH